MGLSVLSALSLACLQVPVPVACWTGEPSPLLEALLPRQMVPVVVTASAYFFFLFSFLFA